jgi:hypothetical protein
LRDASLGSPWAKALGWMTGIVAIITATTMAVPLADFMIPTSKVDEPAIAKLAIPESFELDQKNAYRRPSSDAHSGTDGPARGWTALTIST